MLSSYFPTGYACHRTWYSFLPKYCYNISDYMHNKFIESWVFFCHSHMHMLIFLALLSCKNGMPGGPLFRHSLEFKIILWSKRLVLVIYLLRNYYSVLIFSLFHSYKLVYDISRLEVHTLSTAILSLGNLSGRLGVYSLHTRSWHMFHLGTTVHLSFK